MNYRRLISKGELDGQIVYSTILSMIFALELFMGSMYSSVFKGVSRFIMPIEAVLVVLAFSLAVIKLVSMKQKQIIVILLLTLIIAAWEFVFIGNRNLAILLLLGFSTMKMNFNQLIKVHFWTLLATTVFVVLSSFVGILPITGKGVNSGGHMVPVLLGFINYNSFGSVVTFLIVEYSMVTKRSLKLQYVLLVLGILLNTFLGFRTGTLALLIFGLILILKNHKRLLLYLVSFEFLVSLIASIYFTFFAKTANTFNSLMNIFMSNRPIIWQWYSGHYSITFWGQKVDMALQHTSNNLFIRSFSFDNAYMFALYFWGILGFVALLWLEGNFIKVANAKSSVKVLGYVGVLIIFSTLEKGSLLISFTPFIIAWGCLLTEKNLEMSI